MSSVDFIDPIRDDSYAELVAAAPGSEIFHDRLWLELLRDEYGYEIGACCVRDGEGSRPRSPSPGSRAG